MKIKLISILPLIFHFNKLLSQNPLPKTDHVVILVLENHGYEQIISSPYAPYINELTASTFSASFTQSYAIEHPSQPNYLDFFSGDNQGVNHSGIPTNNPFTTPNLARQLIDSGYTYMSYSEDLPSVGFNEIVYNYYVRRHNPACNWIGTGINQIPDSVIQPFSVFPTDFTKLPTVSYVIPNQLNNMHDGTDPERIIRADKWVETNLKSYIEWAKSNNSLFILLFDEDDNYHQNHIVTIFSGQMVKPGFYDEKINLFTILRTLEAMYHLPSIGKASNETAIESCWDDGTKNNELFEIFPNPANHEFTFQTNRNDLEKLSVLDNNGNLVQEFDIKNYFTKKISLSTLRAGIYFVTIEKNGAKQMRKLVVD